MRWISVTVPPNTQPTKRVTLHTLKHRDLHPKKTCRNHVTQLKHAPTRIFPQFPTPFFERITRENFKQNPSVWNQQNLFHFGSLCFGNTPSEIACQNLFMVNIAQPVEWPKHENENFATVMCQLYQQIVSLQWRTIAMFVTKREKNPNDSDLKTLTCLSSWRSMNLGRKIPVSAIELTIQSWWQCHGNKSTPLSFGEFSGGAINLF